MRGQVFLDQRFNRELRTRFSLERFNLEHNILPVKSLVTDWSTYDEFRSGECESSPLPYSKLSERCVVLQWTYNLTH